MDISELAYIDDTGYHYPDYPTTLAWLQDQYRAIYGADVYLESDSQDGQFLAVTAKAFYDTMALGAAVYSSFSPTTAQGAGLSRVVKINGIARQVATYSTVVVTIVGQSGTVISNGVVQDTLLQKWDLPATVTIPGSGTVDVAATAQDIGAIAAAIGTVTTIFTPTNGWQTVTNSAAATEGNPVEADSALRIRQTLSTANPSLTVFEGTMGAVENVSGVSAARGYENDTDSTDANGIPAHSIEVVAEGGNATEIAQAIADHKTPGTGTAGSTATVVTDSGGMPLTIRFQRPTAAPISVQITLTAFASYSTDYNDLITAAVAAAVNALGIGNDVFITKLLLSAYLSGVAGDSYDITIFKIARDANPFGLVNIDIDFDELPTCDAADVDLVFV